MFKMKRQKVEAGHGCFTPAATRFCAFLQYPHISGRHTFCLQISVAPQPWPFPHGRQIGKKVVLSVMSPTFIEKKCTNAPCSIFIRKALLLWRKKWREYPTLQNVVLELVKTSNNTSFSSQLLQYRT